MVEQSFFPALSLAVRGFTEKSFYPEVREKQSPGKLHPEFLFHQENGDGRQSETHDQAVHGVRDGRAEPRDKSRDAAFRQRPADA